MKHLAKIIKCNMMITWLDYTIYSLIDYRNFRSWGMRWLYMILMVKRNSGIAALENEKNTVVITFYSIAIGKPRGSSPIVAGGPAIITANHLFTHGRLTILCVGANLKIRNDPAEKSLLFGWLEQTETILSSGANSEKIEAPLASLSLFGLLPGSSSPFSILILVIPNYCYNNYVISINYLKNLL